MKNKLKKMMFLIYLVLFSFNSKVYAAGNYSFTCDDLGRVRQDLNNIFDFVKVLVPLLIIGLSSYDFIKALTAKDEKDVKKAFQRLIKRFVAGVIIFFLPFIIDFILYLAQTNSEVCINK